MRTSVSRSVRAVIAGGSLLVALFGAQACGENPVKPSDYGVEATDLVVGTGTEAKVGRGVTVHYTLWLFDESRPERKGEQIETTAGGQPYSFFPLGYGRVISGWDVGIPGMKVGGTRRLVVPPQEAYGSAGKGPIPPNATLVFDVQLVGVY